MKLAYLLWKYNPDGKSIAGPGGMVHFCSLGDFPIDRKYFKFEFKAVFIVKVKSLDNNMS